MYSVTDVPSNSGSCVACIDDAFVSGDGDLYVFFVESAPEFLDQVNDTLLDFWRYVVADLEVLVEIGLVSLRIEFNASECWVAVIVGEGRLRALADYITYRGLVKELEIGVNIR
jgi:hypothetical protein